MQRKTICIFVCMMFFVIIIPPFGAISGKVIRENLISSSNSLAIDAFLKISGADGESNISAGLSITIINIGYEIIQDIDWTFNTSGGILIFGDGKQGGRLPISLNPNDETKVILKPIPRLSSDADGQSPIGLGIINIKVTIQAIVGSTIQSGSVTSKAFLLGPIIFI